MWGKVKFSHLCVILFTKGGGLHPGESASRGFASGQSASGGSVSRGVCLPEGGLHPGGLGRPPRIHGILQVGLHPGGGGWADPRDTCYTTGYGQQVGGMYPTKMHSCS